MYTCMCSIPWLGNARHVLTAGHKQLKASVRGENIKSCFDRSPQSPKLLKMTPPSIGTSFVQIIKGAWIIMTLRQMKWQFIRPMTHRSHEPGYCCSKAIWICTRLDKVVLDASLGSKHNTHDVKVLNWLTISIHYKVSGPTYDIYMYVKHMSDCILYQPHTSHCRPIPSKAVVLPSNHSTLTILVNRSLNQGDPIP